MIHDEFVKLVDISNELLVYLTEEFAIGYHPNILQVLYSVIDKYEFIDISHALAMLLAKGQVRVEFKKTLLPRVFVNEIPRLDFTFIEFE